jgi:ubiquinone/menaquinone biosynthesis C-methylase UbiE
MNGHHSKTDFLNSASDRWKNFPDERQADYITRALKHLHSNAKNGDKVIDIGCGTGILFPFLDPYEVTGVDISLEIIRHAKDICRPCVKEICAADVHSLPFGNDHFQHATMLAVFPHIDYPEIALAEVRRVLSPGGTLSIIHTSTREAINNFHLSIGGVIANDRLLEEAEMHLLLSQAGFSVLHQETAEGYFFFAQKV